MVLLTITPAILQALRHASGLSSLESAKFLRDHEATLPKATLGDPISHVQLIDLANVLKQDQQHHQHQYCTTLASLLCAATLYIPPPPPKPTPSPEYTALMARLRRDQEALSYARLLNPPPVRESFSPRGPRAPQQHFSVGSVPNRDEQDDDVSYEEVHRQIILIINILVSIVAVAVFIWVAARHWSVGKRLGLSLGGSLGIAVAEVAVYAGYVRKVKEAKTLEKKKPEIKEIVRSWIIDKSQSVDHVSAGRDTDKAQDGPDIRFRKGKHR